MHFDVTQQFEVVFSKIIINLQSLAKLLTQNTLFFSAKNHCPTPPLPKLIMLAKFQAFNIKTWPDSVYNKPICILIAFNNGFSQPKTTEKKLCLPNQCFSKIFWPDSTFESMLLYGLELFIVCHHLTKLGGHGH